MYLQKYWRYENETYMVCKAHSDSHVSIMTLYHTKMTSYILKIRHLASTILDFKTDISEMSENLQIWFEKKMQRFCNTNS